MNINLLGSVLCKKFTNQQLNIGNIPSNLIYGILFLRSFEIKVKHVTGTHMLLTNYSSTNIVLFKHLWQASNVVERVEMMFTLVQSVHSVLMAGLTGQ